MNKLELNKQIVLCRPQVKRARVCTIRKILRRVKMLEATKKQDEEAGKKKQKAERLMEQIMIMKKLKLDDVTKFALLHSDLDKILKTTKTSDHDHIYALLAKHSHVLKRITDIRDQVPDPENTIRGLLQSLGERTMLKKWKAINKGLPPNEAVKPRKKLKKEEEEEKVEENPPSSEEEIEPPKEEKKVEDSFFIDKKIVLPKLLQSEPEENKDFAEDFNKQPKRRKDEMFSKIGRSRSFEKKDMKRDYREKGDKFKRNEKYGNAEKGRDNREKIERFTRSEKYGNAEKGRMLKPEYTEPQKPVAQNLHPSWAAKKAQHIQPFQGKKIKFSED